MKRKWLPFVLLPVAAAIAPGWVTWPRPRATAMVLADGSRLEYLGATVGANCSHDYGTTWQRLAARIPVKWRRKLGIKPFLDPVVTAGYSGDSSVIFWFVRRGIAQNTNATKVIYRYSSRTPAYAIGGGISWNATSGSGVLDGLRINLKDESGDGVPGLQYLSEAALPSGDTAVYWRTELVPSNGPVVFLRFYEWSQPTGLKQTREMEVPNPLHGGGR